LTCGSTGFAVGKAKDVLMLVEIPHLLLAKRLKLAPTTLHLEVGLIWWYELFNKKKHDLTWTKLIELSAPKMEGHCQIPIQNTSFEIKYVFLTNQIHWIMWKYERLYAKLC